MKGGVSGASYQSKPNRDKDFPVCGVSRPLDWFGQEQKLVDYKKDGTVRKVVRYRKYHACWKCRATKGIDALSVPPLCEVME